MEITNSTKKYFTRQLMAWHAHENDRSLPWKSEKDPYKIWLSEVILQQTRALQGLPYYMSFTQAYPTLADMANAKDDEAFRLWQGLGYYNRCKNMLATARFIATELHCRFPDTYDDLLALKGIGPYTASAIASFAYGLPNAVVDGNVYRVLSRFFGIDTTIDSTAGKQQFATLAQYLLDKTESAAYNQAIMDLGATVCTPRNPACNTCPLSKKCVAYEQQLIDVLPVKSKKLVVRKRYFHYLLLTWKDSIWIQKRTGKDIWENLHEPYLIESVQPLDEKEMIQQEIFKTIGYSSITFTGKTSQRLTHQIIEARFFTVTLAKNPGMNNAEGKWMKSEDLAKTAFPKTVISFLENNLYF